MKRRLPLLILLLFTGASVSPQVSVPDSVGQGLPVFGTIVSGRRGKAFVELVDPRSLAVVVRSRAFPAGARQQAFLMGVPSTLAPGPYMLRVAGDALERDWVTSLEVTDRDYPSQRIPLSSELSDLLLSDDPRKAEEWRELRLRLNRFDPDAVYDAPLFVPPVTEWVQSSGYGLVRRYVYSDGTSSTSVHNGTDLALPEGTPIVAPAAARVVMVKTRVISGKTIVLEHLPGFYSLYYHLSEVDVAEGDVVAKGTRIGAVGSTGLATGPHLHWEVRIGGIAVDPEALLAQVDIASLSSIIFGLKSPNEGR